jgi:acyl-CoA thioesterase
MLSDELKEQMARAPWAERTGCRLQEVDTGYARVSLTPDASHTNFMGTVDGGLVMSLADYAFACACNTYGDRRVAAHFSTNIINAPELGAEMLAEARTVHAGRRMAVTEITVSQQDRVIARCTGTAITLSD